MLVSLTQETSSQLHSGFIWVHAVARHFAMVNGYTLCPVKVSSKNINLVRCKLNEIHSFCNCIFVPKRRWNSGYIHVLLDELSNSHAHWANLWAVTFYTSIHPLLDEYRKAVTLLCGELGDGMGQGPASEVTHLG